MELEILDVVIKVAACVCGKDGVISEAEEQKMFEVMSEEFPNYTLQRFNQAIDDFFDECLQLEDYLKSISKEELKDFTISFQPNFYLH